MKSEVEEFLGIESENVARPEIRRSPVFGTIAIITPFLGFALAYCAASNSSHEGEGWGAFVVFFLAILASLLLGLISAIIGLIRSEKMMLLTLLALALNLCPILWLLSH